jgi:uncharacterized protein YceH (UPF0502 family)
LAILAELMLRGPQTLGELRGRASRMQPFESLESVSNLLTAMMEREEPLVRRMAPAPGSRAERYAQLLAPDSHPADGPMMQEQVAVVREGSVLSLSERVTHLEVEVAALREVIRKFAQGLGEPDPFSKST